MMTCEICGNEILISTPGCHTIGVCRVHGLMWVMYPPYGKCTHAKTLDDKAQADKELAVA
jgi:hypothetical protein